MLSEWAARKRLGLGGGEDAVGRADGAGGGRAQRTGVGEHLREIVAAADRCDNAGIEGITGAGGINDLGREDLLLRQ